MRLWDFDYVEVIEVEVVMVVEVVVVAFYDVRNILILYCFKFIYII
jgi:hypothetical protein